MNPSREAKYKADVDLPSNVFSNLMRSDPALQKKKKDQQPWNGGQGGVYTSFGLGEDICIEF